MHTFSHGNLDFIVSGAIRTLVCVVLLILLAIPTNIIIRKYFCILFIYFLAHCISCLSSLVDEGTVQSIKLRHSWTCLVHVQWMKAQSRQSRTVNPCLFKYMYSLCTLAICIQDVCVCGGGGGGLTLDL